MSSNYPPGVSGSDPHITGEWPVDPHAPFTVVREDDYFSTDQEDERGFVVFEPGWHVVFGNEEDAVFGLYFQTEVLAQTYADALNGTWPSRSCDWKDKGDYDVCTVCGDVRGDMGE